MAVVARGPLFRIPPFAALTASEENGKAVYLIERHSLQMVPGAKLDPEKSSCRSTQRMDARRG